MARTVRSPTVVDMPDDILVEDVAFDQVLARRAADTCDAAADAVRVATGLDADVADARLGWSGLTRGQFDRAVADLGVEAEATVAALRHLARAIRDAADAALVEQHRRVDLRAGHTAPPRRRGAG